mmetsp:Transcript_9964/g.21564  ORF Transcript_9964/g.21564 Transcript_9964/m.21564 type:complete len:99 (-) Transcript_9964:308-604(-)
MEKSMSKRQESLLYESSWDGRGSANVWLCVSVKSEDDSRSSESRHKSQSRCFFSPLMLSALPCTKFTFITSHGGYSPNTSLLEIKVNEVSFDPLPQVE